MEEENKKFRKVEEISSFDLAINRLIIILGSDSDWKNFVKDSKLHDILKEIGISYIVVVISAHRNHEELEKFCKRAVEAHPTVVFAGIAGGAAALPGAIAAIFKGLVPVIGIALSSKNDPEGRYALSAMTLTPGDIPVSCAGVDESGLSKAGFIAAQIIGREHGGIRGGLSRYIHDNGKETKILLGTFRSSDEEI